MLARSRTVLLAIVAVLCTAPIGAQALSTDREQPIQIEANAAEADNRKQVTVYRGDVIITQGTLRITGDTVWIHYDDANTITKAVSVGTPAKFRQLLDGKKDYMTADAERMEYHADQDLILLLGNARYGEGQDKIIAPRILYDSRRGLAKAGANLDAADISDSAKDESDKSDRVRITITPKKK